jgi:hypothetical protein
MSQTPLVSAAAPIVIGLSAVVAGIREGELSVLTVRPEDASTHRASDLRGLPFGPFDPAGDRTFELALRSYVTAQTGFSLGYVEQLYTFGDKGRDAPLADLGVIEAAKGARMISVGYLALTPQAKAPSGGGLAADAAWRPWTRYFPWEDWRRGRPAMIEGEIGPALLRWADGDAARLARARQLFALGKAQPWNEERVLDRYELLYEAGLAREAERDHDRAEGARPPEPSPFDPTYGRPLVSDHRRILATALGRLRGKLKYRPVVFELMPEAFTLLDLQRAVEAISGVRVHKQNFRRMIERTGLVEGLGRMHAETGGRPAELFRYRREALATRGALGLSLPAASEG